MSVPKVYGAISAVAAALGKKGIAKTQTNAQDQYPFRSIDDVYNQLSPALAANKLCILPRVLERVAVERTGSQGALLLSVSVRTAFDLVSAEDGSVHVIEAYGEALDSGDKATSKAMSAAFKHAVLQAFCIPVKGLEDADAVTHQLRKSDHVPEPVQGWERWALDIADVVKVCETGEALDRLQNMNRALLTSVSRERPDLYARVGEEIRERRAAITRPPARPAAKSPTSPTKTAAKPARKPRRKAAAKVKPKPNGATAHANA